jgi:hypothetical protein
MAVSAVIFSIVSVQIRRKTSAKFGRAWIAFAA